MQDDTGKGSRDQARLLKVLPGGRSRAPAHPYCGYGGDSEILEETLWSYAEGEMPLAEEEALEEHTNSCRYCQQRLAVICRSLEVVEQEPGFSREKIQALLDRQGAGKRVRWFDQAGQALQAFLDMLRRNWRPLSAATAALVVVISLALFYPGRRGPVPLGEFLSSVSRPALPGEVEPRHMAQALSLYGNQLWAESPVRALLPGARPEVSVSFLYLGFLCQHLETLAGFSPLEGPLRDQGDLLAQEMESRLRGLTGEGPLYLSVTLYRERLLSGLYGTGELEPLMNRMRGELFILADSPEYRVWKARRAMELGMWLSHLNRDLSLVAQGLDRRKELRDLFLPEYVEALQEYCPLYLGADAAPVIDPALEVMAAAARESRARGLSSEQARASLRAVMDIVGCAVR